MATVIKRGHLIEDFHNWTALRGPSAPHRRYSPNEVAERGPSDGLLRDLQSRRMEVVSTVVAATPSPHDRTSTPQHSSLPEGGSDSDRSSNPSSRQAPSPASEGGAAEDLACVVCFQLPDDPVRWPAWQEVGSTCVHTFCRRCVMKCVERGHACPLCRAPAAPDAKVETLPTDRAAVRLMHERAPRAYMARLGEVMREHVICEQQPLLHTYCIGKAYDLKPGRLMSIPIREPQHWWLLLRLYMTGSRRLGLLFSNAEAVGAEGVITGIRNLPFYNGTLSFDQALGRVLWWKQSGSMTLKLRVMEPFKVMALEHKGEGAETTAQWERLLAHVAPNASASQRSSRTVFVRAVSGPTPQALALATVKADAAADALVGEMLQELKRRIEFKRRARSMRGDADGADGSSGDGPLSAEQQRRRRGHTRDDSSGSEASSFSTSLSSPRFGPYFDFALAVGAMRLTSRWTPGSSREPSIHGGGSFGAAAAHDALPSNTPTVLSAADHDHGPR